MEKRDNGGGPGTLYVIGTGPGALDNITGAAIAALKRAEVVVGYSTYLSLIDEIIRGKEILSSEMMKEVERCRTALSLAETGKQVALVSGGDPGIYAMAGLVFEIAEKEGYGAAIEIIPGIAAVNGCAARLGAPLMHDFAAISLSDLLTPWERIEKRLEAAAMADFVTVIYNPRSKKRTKQLVRAREIFLRFRSPQTVTGIVTAATRIDEHKIITTLDRLLEHEIGMQSTIIIGNSQTYTWSDLMITPRGYGEKYKL
ncbi:MAG: precorrin-3B C(17)-methyltransferase [Deltaproteobacteria bacterium]|nr:MAG: precorrin-3B C(17)-methyltransferase [Deltaproteobacteria bacterium]